MTASRRAIFGWGAATVVVASVVGGMVVLGPPSQRRVRKLDQRRVQDLREAAGAVDLHWTREGRLPASLDELSGEGGTGWRDRETGQPYRYQTLDGERYRLCATFGRESARDRWGGRADFWAHEAGEHCFDIDVKRVER